MQSELILLEKACGSAAESAKLLLSICLYTLITVKSAGRQAQYCSGLQMCGMDAHTVQCTVLCCAVQYISRRRWLAARVHTRHRQISLSIPLKNYNNDAYLQSKVQITLDLTFYFQVILITYLLNLEWTFRSIWQKQDSKDIQSAYLKI